jgi:hypothetical protein
MPLSGSFSILRPSLQSFPSQVTSTARVAVLMPLGRTTVEITVSRLEEIDEVVANGPLSTDAWGITRSGFAR